MNRATLRRHIENATCTLCKNTGVIQTEGILTPQGKSEGQQAFCICPAGQSLRAQQEVKP